MRILVVYDGSLDSPAALNHGLEKVKEKGARLIVLHVFPSNMFIDYEVLPATEEHVREELLQCMEDARRIISESGEDLRAKVVMEEGNPEEEIITCVKTQNIDLIVTPTHYKSVVKKTVCPVLVVHGCVPAEHRSISDCRHAYDG